MSASGIEVADVIRRFLGEYLRRYGEPRMPEQRRAIADLLGCMTREMGGKRYRCSDCGESFWQYHGCRNRSCPKCHGRQTQQWIEARSAELLPCDYFHLVTTVPSELRPAFRAEQKYMYDLLMKISAAALCELAADRRYLGAVPAIMSVLHTWNGWMLDHIHAMDEKMETMCGALKQFGAEIDVTNLPDLGSCSISTATQNEGDEPEKIETN